MKKTLITGVAALFLLFAVLLSLSTGTLNARDADFGSRTFAAAHTAKGKCINTCRARYRDCLSLKQIPSSECRGIYQDCTATLVMLVQLVDRLGQGSRVSHEWPTENKV